MDSVYTLVFTVIQLMSERMNQKLWPVLNLILNTHHHYFWGRIASGDKAVFSLSEKCCWCSGGVLTNQGTRCLEYSHHNQWCLAQALPLLSTWETTGCVPKFWRSKKFILKDRIVSDQVLDAVSWCRTDTWTPSTVFCMTSKQVVLNLFRKLYYLFSVFICISKFFQHHQLSSSASSWHKSHT